MWPFKRKKISLEQSGTLRGFTDCHSHILPGVDDGVKTLRESLAILAKYEDLGISDLWLTPHIMEDIPNTTEDLRRRFDDFTKTYDGPVKLHLAAEYMMDSLLDERLGKNDLLPHGEDGGFILVETSYFNKPIKFETLFDEIKSKGYYPILAHPERYAYMRLEEYAEIHDRGVLFQMNLGSMAGIYGQDAQSRASFLQKEGLYDMAGGDIHSRQMLETILSSNNFKIKAL